MTQHRRTERVAKEVVYQTVCDACGKTAGPDPDGWHRFLSHHHDWGNDSIESCEHWDACSWACYVAIVRKVIDEYGEHGGYETLEVDDRDLGFLRNMLRSVGGES